MSDRQDSTPSRSSGYSYLSPADLSVAPAEWSGLGEAWVAGPDSLPAALPGACFSLHTPVGRVAVYRAGPEGGSMLPPLLLIHGVNAAASSYEVRPLFSRYRAHRVVYALDLPGFGRSARVKRAYTPAMMVDAVLAVAEAIRQVHGGVAVDALGLSLGCEFLARASLEAPLTFRSLALVSPTGMGGRHPRKGPPQSHMGVPGLRQVLSVPLWSQALYRGITHPRMIRHFLRRAWGAPGVDRGLLDYSIESAQQPGARYAVMSFLSGELFSGDAFRLYCALTLPVWLAHGIRGEFVDYRGKARLSVAPNWRVQVFPSGALPHFEARQAFCSAYDRFLDWAERIDISV
jgi:pimeloyl-ACP methyl ester carboxylesterase